MKTLNKFIDQTIISGYGLIITNQGFEYELDGERFFGAGAWHPINMLPKMLVAQRCVGIGEEGCGVKCACVVLKINSNQYGTGAGYTSQVCLNDAKAVNKFFKL